MPVKEIRLKGRNMRESCRRVGEVPNMRREQLNIMQVLPVHKWDTNVLAGLTGTNN